MPQKPPNELIPMQRVDAAGLLRTTVKGGRTRIEVMRQESSAKIRIPRSGDPGLEAILINTAGGLTGGDRLAWSVEAGSGSSLVVTTQACEKAYRSSGGEARIDCRLRLEEGSRISWLPQETIFYEGAALTRRMDADLGAGSSLLMVEASIFGRLAHGEMIDRVSFRDRWRVRREGRLVHAEDFSIGPETGALLRRRAVAGGALAIATVLFVSDDVGDFLEPVRSLMGDNDGVSVLEAGGTGKLLARLISGTGFEMRKKLVPLLCLLNGKAGLPKVWSI